MADKRRIATVLDPSFDKITLDMLRTLVEQAVAQEFRGDSSFEIFVSDDMGYTYLALNEVTP